MDIIHNVNDITNRWFTDYQRVLGLAPARPSGCKPLCDLLARPLQAYTTPAGSETFKLYYYAGAQAVAMRVLTASNGPGAVYSIHADHLGSTAKMTNAARQVVQAVYYEPFGRVRGVSTAGGLTTGEPASYLNNRTFTGQYRESAAAMGSLMHYGARQYSPYLGRMLSADTIVPQPGNAQLLNRYSYALNSPTVYADPSGHWPDWEDAYYFGMGVAYQVSASALDGMAMNTNVMARQQVDAMAVSVAETRGHGDAFAAGRAVGGIGAIAVGVGEAVMGFDMMAGGVATCAATVGAGCVPGVAVAGAGVGMVAVGSSTVVNGAVAVGSNLSRLAQSGRGGGDHPFPRVIDPRTGRPLSTPPKGLQVVPESQRVSWTNQDRAAFIKEWIDRGYSTPQGGWDLYDIHHIIPREYGGTNDFSNLVPVLRTVHQQQINPWWSNYTP